LPNFLHDRATKDIISRHKTLDKKTNL
jgi:hypothetical protein